jgi:hypothetical protein
VVGRVTTTQAEAHRHCGAARHGLSLLAPMTSIETR